MTTIRPLTHKASIAAICLPLLLSACANMSGVGGSDKYGCKAPQGVQCDSVSGNYYNAIQNNLPSQRQHRMGLAVDNDAASGSQPATMHALPSAGMLPGNGTAGSGVTPSVPIASPLRSQARVLRLWFKPWEDADHDLYDQGFVYVQIDAGNWLIDHAQQHIRDAYAPVRSATKATTSISPSAIVPTQMVNPRFLGASTPDGNAALLGVPPASADEPSPNVTERPAGDKQ